MYGAAIKFFLVFVLALSTMKIFIKFVLSQKYLIWRKGRISSNVEIKKFGSSCYKFIYYVSSVLMGIIILKNEKWIFNVSSYGIPIKTIPVALKVFYMYGMSFYIVEFVSIFIEERKKDFFHLIFHHSVTFALLALSFNRNFIKLGVLILFLHCISDPIFEFCKMEYYMKNYLISNVLFFIFMVVFMALRLLIFPRWLIVASMKALLYNGEVDFLSIARIVLLIILQIVHLFWSKCIISIFNKIINCEDTQDQSIDRSKSIETLKETSLEAKNK